MKLINREKTIANLADSIIDGMTIEDMQQWLYEYQIDWLNNESDISLIEQLEMQAIDKKGHVV